MKEIVVVQDLLMKRIKSELQKWDIPLQIKQLPADSTKLSYWVHRRTWLRWVGWIMMWTQHIMNMNALLNNSLTLPFTFILQNNNKSEFKLNNNLAYFRSKWIKNKIKGLHKIKNVSPVYTNRTDPSNPQRYILCHLWLVLNKAKLNVYSLHKLSSKPLVECRRRRNCSV